MRLLILSLIIAISVAIVQAQHSPDTPDHATPPKPAATKPNSDYVIPDVPHGWNEFDNRFFSTTLGFAPILDATAFTQDTDSITQVGAQESRWDIRSGRFSVRGQIHTHRPINYFLSLEYKGLDRPEALHKKSGIPPTAVGGLLLTTYQTHV